MHIMIEPGATLPLHVTPVDVFFYILQGDGEVEIGEERERVSPDMLIESPKDMPHALHNQGEGAFRVLVVKNPETLMPPIAVEGRYGMVDANCRGLHRQSSDFSRAAEPVEVGRIQRISLLLPSGPTL